MFMCLLAGGGFVVVSAAVYCCCSCFVLADCSDRVLFHSSRHNRILVSGNKDDVKVRRLYAVSTTIKRNTSYDDDDDGGDNGTADLSYHFSPPVHFSVPDTAATVL